MLPGVGPGQRKGPGPGVVRQRSRAPAREKTRGGSDGGSGPVPGVENTLTRAGCGPHRSKGQGKCRPLTAHGDARRRRRPEGPARGGGEGVRVAPWCGYFVRPLATKPGPVERRRGPSQREDAGDRGHGHAAPRSSGGSYAEWRGPRIGPAAHLLRVRGRGQHFLTQPYPARNRNGATIRKPASGLLSPLQGSEAGTSHFSTRGAGRHRAPPPQLERAKLR